MGKLDFIVEIDGVHDRKAFFGSVLSFFSQVDVILTTWGKLPTEVHERLSPFRAPCSWVRRLFFHESNWQLNRGSLPVLLESLCVEERLTRLTWGIHKGNTPLALCGHWENQITINESELVEDAILFDWLGDLKAKGIIESHEKITD